MSTTQVEVKPELLVEGWVPPTLDRDFTVVGKSLDRLDGVAKATGSAQYSGDIKLPGMLYAKILRSPYPHARIKRIDTSKAEALPGVKAVISKNNCQGWCTYWYSTIQPAFSDVVTYVGHEVAAVAAEDIDTATKALDLIEVEYEKLPAVFDPEEARRPGAPQVTLTDIPNPNDPETFGPKRPYTGNVFDGKPGILTRGDIMLGFDQADKIVEGTYKTSFQHHGTIQTRTCVADWDGDRLTMHEASQGVWLVKKDLAWSLGLPLEKVAVRVKYQGGGFGSKASVQRYSHYAAKLSMLAKRPVRLELTRAEEFIVHPRRNAIKIHFRTGVKKDGTLVAMRAESLTDIGAGGGSGHSGLGALSMPFALYRCPNVYFEQWAVHTNLQFTGPMRGPMRIEVVACVEAHMDEVAASIGMDPLDFRLKNYTPYADQTRKTFYSSKLLDKAMLEIADRIGWYQRKPSPPSNIMKKGMGMAIYVGGGVGNGASKAQAEVLLRNDGKAELHAGIVDIGTGSATTLSMIAAEELGVNLDDVRIVYGDTDLTPYAPSSHSSRIIPEMGPAVLQASAQVRERLFAIIASKMNIPPSDLASSNGWVYSKSNPSRRISFKEACNNIGSETIKGSGSRLRNPTKNNGTNINEPGKVSLATFGAAAVEVEVDTETGDVKVLRAVMAHEFGKVLNPKIVDSQFYGGFAFGLGLGVLEEPILDKKTGIMLNSDFHQYRMATMVDMPMEIVPIKLEGVDPFFAYSAKGGGDYTNCAIPGAIRNAVHDATGAWVNEYPLTRDRVLAALAKTKGENS
jgi:xanthine dehydrogenase molybdenum-binding subunit